MQIETRRSIEKGDMMLNVPAKAGDVKKGDEIEITHDGNVVAVVKVLAIVGGFGGVITLLVRIIVGGG